MLFGSSGSHLTPVSNVWWEPNRSTTSLLTLLTVQKAHHVGELGRRLEDLGRCKETAKADHDVFLG